MELGIRNFTEAGNNLMWRNGWRNYQKEKCLSKGYSRMENKVHYDRILNSLTDNRSIDVLVEPSLENVKKMSEKEFIIKYVNEVRGKMKPQEIAVAIAVALDVPVEDTSRIRSIFDLVMEQLKNDPPQLAEISIAIDDRPIEIIADDFGVRASENPISFTGVSSVTIDEESGERGVQIWEGDNQAPVRGINPTDAGYRMSEVPAQFSVPSLMPPPMRPVTFNRQAMPDTNPIILQGPTRTAVTQTYEDYPSAPVPVTRGIVLESAVAKQNTTAPFVGRGFSGKYRENKEVQTAQTGPEGMFTTKEQRGQVTPSGKVRYAIYPTRNTGRSIEAIRQNLSGAFAESSRLPSGAMVFSPTGPFSFPTSSEGSGAMTPVRQYFRTDSGSPNVLLP